MELIPCASKILLALPGTGPLVSVLLFSGCHSRLDDLLNRNLVLTVLEAQKSTIKGLADSVSGQSPLPGLQTHTFLLYLHMAERERDQHSQVLPYKGTNPIHEGPTLMI